MALNKAIIKFSESQDKVKSTKRINLEDNAVVNSIIENGAVTKDKLAAGSVTLDKLDLELATGVVHSTSPGTLTSSLIVNDDIASSAAIADTKLATISSNGKVANSATTATSANTSGAIVSRDGSGNFSAGNITVTGETISSFTNAGIVHNDNNGVLSSSLIVNADIASTAAIADSKLATISTANKVANSATTATSANTASTIVSRDASGNFAAGNITVTGETISSFTTAGIVHNDASGNLSSSLIVNADIADGTISAAKLASGVLSGSSSSNLSSSAINPNTISSTGTIASGYSFNVVSSSSTSTTFTINSNDNVVGKLMYIYNSGTTAGDILVSTGSSINGTTSGTNFKVPLPKNKLALFICYAVSGSNGTWVGGVLN